MTDSDADILNWCRWHWTALRWHRRRVASLEGLWRSPQPWDAPPVTSLGAIDVLLAQIVEDAWRELCFAHKMMLKWHYVFRLAPGQICRQIRRKGYYAKEDDYAMLILSARGEFEKAIASQKQTAHNREIAVVCEQKPAGRASFRCETSIAGSLLADSLVS